MPTFFRLFGSLSRNVFSRIFIANAHFMHFGDSQASIDLDQMGEPNDPQLQWERIERDVSVAAKPVREEGYLSLAAEVLSLEISQETRLPRKLAVFDSLGTISVF